MLFMAATAWAAPTGPARKAGVFEPPRMAPELALRGSDGTALNLSRYRGKLVLLSFGCTSCTEVCPVTLAQARKALGAAGVAVQVVYVKVDPERDDPQRMKTWLDAFDPSFIGGTGLGLAVLVAVPLGLWMGWVGAAYRTFKPIFQMLRPISPIAWISLAILWFGVGDLSPVFLIFISSVCPMIVQTTSGVHSIERHYLRAAANFGVSREGCGVRCCARPTWSARSSGTPRR